MNKVSAIIQSYQIATLTYPSDEVLSLLSPLPYDRVLELLLILRQSPRTVKSPLNFLRRAIDEGWTPETLPQKNINRRAEDYMINFYRDKGFSEQQIQQKILDYRDGR
ncbi:hypothetical protein [Longirhabdus pacifica]|uniref:hypothetical protein n=1 Tax=Longirhabdus pacifica TaxID=2305227 RepID=UPI001F0BA5FE|nr:hypothetical protein [Longirhabdus pacifica]